MRVLILGGDGYLGWPTCMHLSSNGHEVACVDNYLRRKIMHEEGMEPLLRNPDLNERVSLWHEISGKNIQIYIGDLNEWKFISRVFQGFKPDAIIHYAEQPSAPYSMLNRESAMLTLNNNINVTANVIFATREFCPTAHIIKLGTMGEYGTPNIDIEEGWLDIKHNGREDVFLYPRQAGSLYHTTKIMDTDLLWYYVRIWDLKVTDLMQGPVYGLFTDESSKHKELLTLFSYDEIFGTVLNRFIVQAVAGYPLTVYGKGGQTRGYLNIKDTLECVRIALEHPAASGELRIFNQFTETFSVNQLADMVCKAGKEMGITVETQQLENPRNELEEHYYNPKHTGLLELGLQPHLLTQDMLIELMEFILLNSDFIHKNKIFRGTKWA